MNGLVADIDRRAEIGEGTIVEDACVVGKPSRDPAATGGRSILGSGCHIRHFTTIYEGARLGDRVQTGQGVSIREDNVIGDDVSIGTNTVLEPGNRIGARTRIHTGCFLELVTTEEDVFIGPNVTFADDLHPPCPRYKDCVRGAIVGEGASIGANATILPGVAIGKRALVGAGSVVVHDVPDGAVVVGNPARQVCAIDDLECQSKLVDRPYGWRT